MATGSIIDLLMPVFSGSTDEYGKQVVPLNPLTFDRMNEGKVPTSTSRLFQLPIEILAVIIQSLPASSLSDLAFVSRDCQQWARSRQFCSVQFNYSNATLGLLRVLLREGQERAVNGGYTILPSLGACVRRVQIATDSSMIMRRHNIRLDEDFSSMDAKARESICDDASAIFFDLYMPTIENLLSSRAVLPHLESLDCEDICLFPSSFFNGLINSNLRHLKFFRSAIKEDFELHFPQGHSKQWPLQTLHLEIIASFGKKSRTTATSRLSMSILRACAKTLESLTWGSSLRDNKALTFSSNSDPALCFDKLRYVKLAWELNPDSTILEALVHDGLEALEVNLEHQSTIDFFKHRGKIPSLVTFISPSLKEYGYLKFLRSNSQLSKLGFILSSPAALLEGQLLPLLSKSFSNLASLSLSWSENTISESAIQCISTLTSLKQLQLGAGQQYGWKCEWLIDHTIMRKHLAKLPYLTKLAIKRDL